MRGQRHHCITGRASCGSFRPGDDGPAVPGDRTGINSVREDVTSGASALFLLSSDAVLDRVRDEFRGTQTQLITTNLSGDQE
jgi:hypothetical protein